MFNEEVVVVTVDVVILHSLLLLLIVVFAVGQLNSKDLRYYLLSYE